jgi:SNF2 family DNA or RNA helicase
MSKMLFITTRGKAGVVSGTISAATLDVIRDMPGRKKLVRNDSHKSELLFELSATNLEHLFTHLTEAKWSSEARERLDKIHLLREQEKLSEEAKLQGPPESFTFAYKTKPYAHQAKAFFLSRDKLAYALFMEMGTGKTKVSLDITAYLYMQGEVTSVLITAPNGVHTQWILEQIPAHLPDSVKYKAFDYTSNLTAERKRALQEVLNYKEGLRILAVNIEALSGEKGLAFIKDFLQSDPDNLWIIDESVLIKNPSSSRTKNCLKLAPLAKYKRILSGAPVTKGIEDLYTQFRFLDPDILGHNSFYTFRNRYCVMGGWENKKVIDYMNVEELSKKIEAWSFRVRKSDCLDLPEKVYITKPVQLTDEQIKLYRELCKEYLAKLSENDHLTVLNGASLIMRLQQLVCGFLPNSEGTHVYHVVPFEKHPRLKAVEDILDLVEGKVIIWARFSHDIYNLQKLLKVLGVSCVTYHGETPQVDRAAAVNNFRREDELSPRVFIGNPAAAGTGLNLAVANTVIYYSNDFNASTRWQSEDRTHRIGMTGSCTYIDLISPHTVDEKILYALKNKKSVSDMIIDRDSLVNFLT